MDKTEKLLKKLTEAYGISGYEDNISEITKKEFEKLNVPYTYDRLGSIIGVLEGKEKSPKIMLSGHMDEIGFIVKHISEGYIKFMPIGYWSPTDVLFQRVIIHARGGDVIGTIIADTEDKKEIKLDDMYIDVGSTKDYDVCEKFNIKVGDPISPVASFEIMANKKMYMAKAFDDRVGVAQVIKVLEKLKDTSHPNTVYGVGSVQEEVGLRGAKTSAAVVKPDLVISFDIGPASDTPWDSAKEQSYLGSGALVIAYDRSMIPNKKLLDFVVETAEAEKIPYSLSLCKGGRDTGAISLYEDGVPGISISMPTRHGHSHSTIINRDDFDAVVNLTSAIIEKLDEKVYKNFIKEGNL